MIKLATDNLVASLSNVALMGQKMRHSLEASDPRGPEIALPDPQPIFLLQASLDVIEDQAEKLSMPVTNSAIWRCRTLIGEFQNYNSGLIAKRTSISTLVEYLYTLSQVFSDEIRSKSIFAIDSDQACYYSDETSHFGEAVDRAFPSASQEISDAGKCRALGRWTACVLHLMRALEPSLNALAKHVHVKPDQNWNTALNQIDAKLKEITKSNDGAPAEQWASEASAHFRVVKNAWRNHAAHGRARYDKEEAVAIYDNVRFLMRTLATQLSE